MVGQGQVCVCGGAGGGGGDCAEGFSLGFPSPPHPTAGLSTPFWNIPSLEAPLSQPLPRAPTQVQPPPLPSASPWCLSLSLTLLVSISCPSVPLSEPRSVPRASLGLSLCLRVSLSPSLSQLGTTCHPPLPSRLPQPLHRWSCPSGPHHSPLGAMHPQQHRASHQASGTLPILGAPRDLCQTFLRSCWAHGAGGGRAGLSPALPPAPGSPALALSAWHRKGSSPAPLRSVAAFPAPWSSSPSQTSEPFPPPLAPPASTRRAGSRGGHWDFEGLTSERRGPALS